MWLSRLCQFGLTSPSYVPPPLFRELREISRYRRKLVQRRSCVRNRVHKVLDNRGIRLGGILSDIFGLNGRLILNALMAGESIDNIGRALTYHVRRKMEPIMDVLSQKLTATDRLLLTDQLDELDRLDGSVARMERQMWDQLSAFHARLQLLLTIPGINRVSACDVLIELGPDLSVFKNIKHLSAWAGLCPGNNERWRQKAPCESTCRQRRHTRGADRMCACSRPYQGLSVPQLP